MAVGWWSHVMGEFSNYKEIKTRTDMEIMMREKLETEEYKVFSIKGSSDSAQEAEILIQTLVI